MAKLYGSHNKIVDQLLEDYAEIKVSDKPLHKMVIIEGPSGTGKTAIIRELYLRLAENDDYWIPLPEVVDRLGAGVDPLAERKVIIPPTRGFTWGSKVMPSFAWWGISCGRLANGEYQNIVYAFKDQLNTHIKSITKAALEHKGLLDKAKKLALDNLGDIGETLTSEGQDALFKFIEDTLNIPLPFAGSLVAWGIKGFKKIHERVEDLRDFTSEVDLGALQQAEQKTAAKELSNTISYFSGGQFVGIVVIEDIHQMGEDMASLLENLLSNKQNKVLIIATAWPEPRTQENVYSEFLRNNEDKLSIVKIPQTEEDTLEKILYDVAPATDAETVTDICAHIKNPLFLKLWLSMDATTRIIEQNQGKIVLSESFKYPTDIYEIIGMRWKELPEDTRKALTFAVVSNPVSHNEDRVLPFCPEITAKTIDNMGELAQERATSGLEEAIEPMLWCRLADGIEAFAEESLADHVRLKAEESYDADTITKITASLWDELVKICTPYITSESLPAVPRYSLIARWIIGLNDKCGFSQLSNENKQVVELAKRTRACELGSIFKFDKAIKLAEESLKRQANIDDDQYISLQKNAMSWLAGQEKYAEAAKICKEVLEKQEKTLGRDHPETLFTRNELASYLAKMGKINEALDLATENLEKRISLLGPEHPAALIGRNNLASYLAKKGRYQDAIKLTEQNLEVRTRLFGADNPDTLRTKTNLASYYAKNGQYQKAVDLAEKTMAERIQVLGPDHPSTLNTQNNLASYYAKMGDYQRAAELAEKTYRQRTAVLGAQHPSTMRTQRNLHSYLLKINEE